MTSCKMVEGGFAAEEGVVAMFLPYHFKYSPSRTNEDDAASEHDILSIVPLLCFLANDSFGCTNDKLQQIVDHRAPYNWEKSALTYSACPFAYYYDESDDDTNSRSARKMAFLVAKPSLEEKAGNHVSLRPLHKGSTMSDLGTADQKEMQDLLDFLCKESNESSTPSSQEKGTTKVEDAFQNLIKWLSRKSNPKKKKKKSNSENKPLHFDKIAKSLEAYLEERTRISLDDADILHKTNRQRLPPYLLCTLLIQRIFRARVQIETPSFVWELFGNSLKALCSDDNLNNVFNVDGLYELKLPRKENSKRNKENSEPNKSAKIPSAEIPLKLSMQGPALKRIDEIGNSNMDSLKDSILRIPQKIYLHEEVVKSFTNVLSKTWKDAGLDSSSRIRKSSYHELIKQINALGKHKGEDRDFDNPVILCHMLKSFLGSHHLSVFQFYFTDILLEKQAFQVIYKGVRQLFDLLNREKSDEERKEKKTIKLDLSNDQRLLMSVYSFSMKRESLGTFLSSQAEKVLNTNLFNDSQNTKYNSWKSVFEEPPQLYVIKKKCKAFDNALHENEMFTGLRLGGSSDFPPQKKNGRPENLRTMSKWPPTGVKEFLRISSYPVKRMNEPLLYLFTRYCNSFSNLRCMQGCVNKINFGQDRQKEKLFLHIMNLVHRVGLRVMNKVSKIHIENISETQWSDIKNCLGTESKLSSRTISNIKNCIEGVIGTAICLKLPQWITNFCNDQEMLQKVAGKDFLLFVDFKKGSYDHKNVQTWMFETADFKDVQGYAKETFLHMEFVYKILIAFETGMKKHKKGSKMSEFEEDGDALFGAVRDVFLDNLPQDIMCQDPTPAATGGVPCETDHGNPLKRVLEAFLKLPIEKSDLPKQYIKETLRVESEESIAISKRKKKDSKVLRQHGPNESGKDGQQEEKVDEKESLSVAALGSEAMTSTTNHTNKQIKIGRPVGITGDNDNMDSKQSSEVVLATKRILPPSFTINDFIDGFKRFKGKSTKHPEALESIISNLKDFMKDVMENGGEAPANHIIVHSNNSDAPSLMQQQNDENTCETEAEAGAEEDEMEAVDIPASDLKNDANTCETEAAAVAATKSAEEDEMESVDIPASSLSSDSHSDSDDSDDSNKAMSALQAIVDDNKYSDDSDS